MSPQRTSVTAEYTSTTFASRGLHPGGSGSVNSAARISPAARYVNRNENSNTVNHGRSSASPATRIGNYLA